MAGARAGGGGDVSWSGVESEDAPGAGEACLATLFPIRTRVPSARSRRAGESTAIPRETSPTISTLRLPRMPTVTGTRSILLHGYAGQVIEAFGNVVVGGNYAVGIVIFAILIVIQFVVITNGAGRVAEVAARFTLDAMPGKQLAVDADLNAGLITEAEARQRRKDIQRAADFYGAMDGASKFVRGDAVAAVIIVFVNIIGGFVIGIFQQGMGIFLRNQDQCTGGARRSPPPLLPLLQRTYRNAEKLSKF